MIWVWGSRTDLEMGTGKAWARQSSPKLAPTPRLYEEEVASLEKVGAFAPTGSKIKQSNYLDEGTGKA